MKSVLFVSAIILPALVGLNRLHEPKAAPAPVVIPCVTLSGAETRVEKTSYLRITRLDDWVKLWRKHKGDRSEGEYHLYYDELGLPLVDFDRYMVIAVFEDTQVCAYGFRVESVSEWSDEIRIHIHRKGPSIGFAKPFPNEPANEPECSACEAQESVPQAYGFFVIPASKKRIILEHREEGEMKEVFGLPPLK